MCATASATASQSTRSGRHASVSTSSCESVDDMIPFMAAG